MKKCLLPLVILFLLTGLNSCDMLNSGSDSSGGSDALEVIGTWDTGYGDIVITDSTITWYDTSDNVSYAYSIVSYSNREWNASETGAGDYGYMVIQYTTAPSWNTSVTGLYNVFRWQNLGSTSFEYGEAYKDGSYHASAEAAISTASDSGGYYSYGYSSATRNN